MTRPLLFALLAAVLSGCSPAPWTRADTVRQGAFLALTAADWHQTREIVRREDEEWLHNNAARATFFALSVTLRSNANDRGINERTLHAAIEKARKKEGK